jgi:hypothetical protein
MLENGGRHLHLMRWGLAPAWVGPAQVYAVDQCAPETVREKPAFKNAIKQRRCLIPADGYYEWQDLSGLLGPSSTAATANCRLRRAAETGIKPNGGRWTASRSSPRRPAMISLCCITAFRRRAL